MGAVRLCVIKPSIKETHLLWPSVAAHFKILERYIVQVQTPLSETLHPHASYPRRLHMASAELGSMGSLVSISSDLRPFHYVRFEMS